MKFINHYVFLRIKKIVNFKFYFILNIYAINVCDTIPESLYIPYTFDTSKVRFDYDESNEIYDFFKIIKLKINSIIILISKYSKPQRLI